MNNKNKKGFTLVELLAVLVVLIVIILIAVNIVNSQVKKAQKNSVEVNANNYIKAVNGVAALSQNIGEDMESGTYSVRNLNKTDIKISGEKPRRGYVILSNYEVFMGCLQYDKYSAIISKGKTTKIEKNSCDINSLNAEYAYTGSEKVFTAGFDGWYKLETWGAQGGVKDDSHRGGYGGYSVGMIYLEAGEKLYVNIGGHGNSDAVEGYATGGYNGGSEGGSSGGAGGGGGATSIASKSGLLKDLSDNKGKVIIVAGGGAGFASYGCSTSIGGSGGGAVGSGGSYAGTQTAGGTGNGQENGSFGKAGGHTNTNHSAPGAGGGYYGGATGSNICVAGGGSGYVGSSRLIDKEMYCEGCTADSSSKSKTTPTSCIESDPTEKCAKTGDGAAKITFLGDNFEAQNNDYEFDYTNGEQVLAISKTGTYKLEVWGAQGGNTSNNPGGYGGYSVGEINLTKGQKLYVNVGGQGTASSTATVNGGYNGGGNGHGGMCGQYGNRNGSSGGGATSIALVSGKLSSLEKYKGTLKNNNTPDNTSDDYYESSKILIVAGGGGGGFNIDNWLVGPGGSSGGKTGYRGTHNSNGQTTDYATGGTQIAPGKAGDGYTNISTRTEGFFNIVNASFGQGGHTTGWDCMEGGGGGGGFYGGGSGSETSGAGGSGYIANPSLTNKKMVMYSSSNEYASDAVQTKTEVTTNTSSTAETNKAKTGNGYAKVTLIN